MYSGQSKRKKEKGERESLSPNINPRLMRNGERGETREEEKACS